MDALNKPNFIEIVMMISQPSLSQRNEFTLGQSLAEWEVVCKCKNDSGSV